VVADSKTRFNAVADDYAAARPNYPPALLRWFCGALRPGEGEIVVDVGSGTGIFSRQLRQALPAATELIGVEPAAEMRAQAKQAILAGEKLDYREGTAERLPLPDGVACAVFAATAAHWFDRPAFFAEAARVLVPGGLIGIADYVRDETNPAVAAATAFLRHHGGPRVYERPDYAAELAQAPGFEGAEACREHAVFLLDPERYVRLVLSSSHAVPALAALGAERAREILLGTATELAQADGLIPYAYAFRGFRARRAA
jgi:SAM-dependent methyltransferase